MVRWDCADACGGAFACRRFGNLKPPDIRYGWKARNGRAASRGAEEKKKYFLGMMGVVDSASH